MSVTFILGICWVIVVLWATIRWYKGRRARMSILERNGIPGPKPHLISGNLREYEAMPNVLWDSHLIQTYGPIVGYYLGAKPVLLVADPELIRRIQRTDASNFLERPRRVPGGINPDPHRALMLGNLPVAEWAQLRKILAPSFNNPSLKLMTSSIVSLVDKMMDGLPSDGLQEHNFYATFQRLTLDIIGKTSFGIDSNILENRDDPLMAAVAAEFTKSTSSALVRLYLCLPEISFLLHPIRIVWENMRVRMGWSVSSALWEQGQRALASRTEFRPDLLQKLVGSNLSQNQIVANSVLFFEAAYETLSSGLAFIIHLLVHHSDVQEKVREEVASYLDEFGTLDFHVMSHLPYMDLVIKESLRLFPPQTTFIGRAPAEDYCYRNEIGETICTIPKGTHVQVALYQIQRSAQGFMDPEKFNPERFLETDSTAHDWWQPFGIGKRGCIGEAFANLVLKLVIGKIISKYVLEKSEHTEEIGTMRLHFKTATMTPQNGSWAKATPSAA